jgi:hypothetical protein
LFWIPAFAGMAILAALTPSQIGKIESREKAGTKIGGGNLPIFRNSERERHVSPDLQEPRGAGTGLASR